MKRLYYVGVIESKDNNKVWALAGIYDTEEQAVSAIGNSDLAFINIVNLNTEIDWVWETDVLKMGYYPFLESEKIGSLTEQV